MSTEPKSDSEDSDKQAQKPPTGADLARAYTELNSGLGSAFKGVDMKPLLDKFRFDVGLSRDVGDGMRDVLRKAMPVWEPPAPIEPVRPVVFDQLPLENIRPYNADIAESTERAAELMQLQHEAIAQLVALTAENLTHAEAQRKSMEAQRVTADRTEIFTRRMSWTSLVVAIASLGAAICAIVVSLTTGGG